MENLERRRMTGPGAFDPSASASRAIPEAPSARTGLGNDSEPEAKPGAFVLPVAVLAALHREGWRGFPGPLAGEATFARRIEYALLHPSRGLALIDRAPRTTPGAVGLMRQTLRAAGLAPEGLPIAYAVVAAWEVNDLPRLLATMLPRGGWTRGARRLSGAEEVGVSEVMRATPAPDGSARWDRRRKPLIAGIGLCGAAAAIAGFAAWHSLPPLPRADHSAGVRVATATRPMTADGLARADATGPAPAGARIDGRPAGGAASAPPTVAEAQPAADQAGPLSGGGGAGASPWPDDASTVTVLPSGIASPGAADASAADPVSPHSPSFQTAQAVRGHAVVPSPAHLEVGRTAFAPVAAPPVVTSPPMEAMAGGTPGTGAVAIADDVLLGLSPPALREPFAAPPTVVPDTAGSGFATASEAMPAADPALVAFPSVRVSPPLLAGTPASPGVGLASPAVIPPASVMPVSLVAFGGEASPFASARRGLTPATLVPARPPVLPSIAPSERATPVAPPPAPPPPRVTWDTDRLIAALSPPPLPPPGIRERLPEASEPAPVTTLGSDAAAPIAAAGGRLAADAAQAPATRLAAATMPVRPSRGMSEGGAAARIPAAARTGAAPQADRESVPSAQRPGARTEARCAAILNRLQLGGEPTRADRLLLRTACAPS
jgi:hypothetical protein